MISEENPLARLNMPSDQLTVPMLNSELERFKRSSGKEDDQYFDGAARLAESLRSKWWYYLLVTAIAVGCGYFAATEFGSYSYVSYTQVRAKTLPFPPGDSHYDPPGIENFAQFLIHPTVTSRLNKEFGIALSPASEIKPFEENFDRRTGVITIKVTRQTAAESASLANQVVAEAIEQSVNERKESLTSSLRYFRSLVGEVEAEAASKRQAKIDRLNSLRTRFASDLGAELELSELSDAVRAQRAIVYSLQIELNDAERLQKVLHDDQAALVGRIRHEVVDGVKSQLQSAISQFSPQSSQAKVLLDKVNEVDRFAQQDVATIEQLNISLRVLGKLLQRPVEMPAEYSGELERISEVLYELRNQLTLLPDKLASASKELAVSIDRRAAVEISGETDFENIPEIIELTTQIERAEGSVEKITAAIDWVQDMQTLDTPSYEQLSPATAANAIPDGNHKKWLAITFGGIGLLLGFPVLLLDLVRRSTTPSEELGRQFGIQMLATPVLVSGRGLQAADPELRLLALRIQQSARHARGSIVLFSSLSDSLSTKELAATVASCLAAREERVLVIDLESIASHRKGLFTKKDAVGNASVTETNGSAASAAADAIDGNYRSDDGEICTLLADYPAAPGSEKMGLARALAGGTRETSNVLIHHGSDGIDRLELGDAELPIEAFASPMMTKLLDEYCKTYTMVLLSGPAAKHLADVQMLASRCDGVLFVAPKRGALASEARRTVVDLIENRNAIMGIAEISV